MGCRLSPRAEDFDHHRFGRGAVDDGDGALLRAFLRRRERRADRALRPCSHARSAGRGYSELAAGLHRRNSQRGCAGVREGDLLRVAGRADGLLFEVQRRGGRETNHPSVEKRPDIAMDGVEDEEIGPAVAVEIS